MAPDPTRDDSGRARHARAQVALLRVITSHLDGAFTILKTADIAGESDPDGRQAALQKAGEALARVHNLAGHIETSKDWKRVHARADLLAAALVNAKRLTNP